MAKYAAILFSVIALAYLGLIIFGLVQAWPWGVIGLVVLANLVILFALVVKNRVGNKEDDYYSKNVDQ